MLLTSGSSYYVRKFLVIFEKMSINVPCVTSQRTINIPFMPLGVLTSKRFGA